MKTYVYKRGNPCEAVIITQAEDFEEVDKKVKPLLEKLGFDTKNGYAHVETITAPIYFV